MATIHPGELEKPTGEYRQYLPDLGLKRFQVMCTQDAHEYAHDFKTLKQPPWLHALYEHWLDLLQEPFKGVTTDGKLGFNAASNAPPGNYAPRILTHCDRSCPSRSLHITR